MTHVLSREIVTEVLPNQLPSKGVFDSVEPINAKDTVGTVSFSGNSDSGGSDNGSLDSSIIAGTPNLHKQRGVFMSDEGFIKLPRSLLRSESWKSLRLKQQKLFIYILEKAQHTNYIFKYNGNPISLSAGEMCISLRRLAEDFNATVKFREEKIDAPFVQRAVSAFTRVGLTDTRTDTGITVVRVTVQGIYDNEKEQPDTPNDTGAIQARYTNEERKEGEDKKETIEEADALDSSLLHNEKKEEKKLPSAFDSSHQQNLTPEKKNHFDQLWKFICTNGMGEGKTINRMPGIKEKDLLMWVKKYEGKEIMECLKMTLKAEPSKTWPGYVTKLLRDRISKKESDSKAGRKLVEETIKKNQMKHIELKQDYFKDLLSDEQSYYHLPAETLTAILKRSFERGKERDADDKRQQEEEDKYY